MEKPFISIIIPIFNTPELILKSCFDSIEKQTFRNFELIVINDGSNSECSKSIELLTAKLPNTILINKQNQGVSAARNDGIKVAKGEYVYFVDADNTLPSDALETLVNIVNNNPNIDLLIGLSIFGKRELTEYQDKIDIPSFTENITENVNLIKVTDKDELVDHLLTGNVNKYCFAQGYFADGPCGKLYKTDLVKLISFPLNLKWDEDTVWLIKLIQKTSNICVINSIVYNSIEYEYSATRKFRPDFFLENAEVIKEEIALSKLFPNIHHAFASKYFQNVFLFVKLYLFHKDNNFSLKQKYCVLKRWVLQSETQDRVNFGIQHLKTNSKKTKIFLLIAKLTKKKRYLLLYFLFKIYSLR